VVYVRPVATVLGVTLMVDHSTLLSADETLSVVALPVQILVSAEADVLTGAAGLLFTVIVIGVRADVPQLLVASA
jgi:hypothetical protein